MFSNWGGEFFKKNLDYRANTNKILEKMNLNSKSNGDSNNSASSSAANSGAGFKSLANSAGNSKRSALEPAAASPAKKLKTTASSFLNSYS